MAATTSQGCVFSRKVLTFWEAGLRRFGCFEMAQQLLSSGYQVALLAVLDTLAPVSTNKPSLGGLQVLITTVGRYIWPFLLDYLYLVTAPDKHPRFQRQAVWITSPSFS